MKRNTVYFYPIVDERERKIVSPVGTCRLTIISNHYKEIISRNSYL